MHFKEGLHSSFPVADYALLKMNVYLKSKVSQANPVLKSDR